MKKVCVILLSVLIVLIFWPQKISAAPPMVLGDAEIVPYKHWEIWVSFTYLETEEDKTYKTPTLEIIYGLFPRLEWSLETTYIIEDKDGDKTEGIECLVTQPKYLILEEKPNIPQISAAFQIEVPTNGEKTRLEFEECVYAPSIAIQKHFGSLLLIGQVKYFIDRKWRYGMDVMYALNNQLKLLGEIYGHHHLTKDKRDELNFRVGFKYKFIENAKVYLAAGRSIPAARENRPVFEANGGIMFEF